MNGREPTGGPGERKSGLAGQIQFREDVRIEDTPTSGLFVQRSLG
jgi:hypothetical protein